MDKLKYVRHWLAIIVFGLLISSCVQTKKITYLQNGKDRKSDVVGDSIMRTYNLKKELYQLKPGDIVSIRVGSITDDKFDFIRQYETDLGIIRKLEQYQQNLRGPDDLTNVNNALNRVNIQSDKTISGLILSRQNTGFTLDVNGELELPELGKMKLEGSTITEAEELVRKKLEGYYETPMVRIQLLNYHFTVLGEVENEGRFTTFDPEITIFDALSLAGNIGEFARRTNIKIIRQENGQAKVIYLNMLDETTLTAENFYVKRNDIIIVPALEARTAHKYTLPNIGRTLGWIGAVTGILALVISLANR